MSWKNENIIISDGTAIKAVSPIIISASRSTDIPAFYSRWFMNRLQKGYLKWINPFNQQSIYISFSDTRLIVFWSKNPKPLIKYLPELDDKGIHYYFQFTLNNYTEENFEPNLPVLEKRIDTFIQLSELIGKEKVIWRFDPLLLTNDLGILQLLDKIKSVGDKLHPFTEKLVISFADIEVYKKVKANLKSAKILHKEFTIEKMQALAAGLTELNNEWGLKIATCAEIVNLDSYGIVHNKCIDDDLIIRLFPQDKKLMDFLGYAPERQGDLFGGNDKRRYYLKDKGQRAACGCIVSKDIGQYNTCNHLCVYCYANHSASIVKRNFANHDPESDSII